MRETLVPLVGSVGLFRFEATLAKLPVDPAS